jgi:hypothetical protein
MLYKALKHKTLEDTFGIVNEDINNTFRIDQCSTPFLQPATANTEMMVEYWTKIGHPEVIEQMADYEMVDVFVTW